MNQYITIYYFFIILPVSQAMTHGVSLHFFSIHSFPCMTSQLSPEPVSFTNKIYL